MTKIKFILGKSDFETRENLKKSIVSYIAKYLEVKDEQTFFENVPFWQN